MIYFWSDTHFNHTGIISYCGRTYPDGRKFANVDEMNGSLIERWNSVVKPNDTGYLIGDFAFCSKERNVATIYKELNGHKHLIVGNHDEKNAAVMKLPWESVSWLKVVKNNKRRVVLCHYPLESWASAHKGVVHLHGHCHGNLKREIPHRFDVGADVYDHPVSFEEIWLWASVQKFEPTDHHGDL